MNKIKNIIFDLGGVVLIDRPSCVLDNLDICDELKKQLNDSFFSNWNDLDLGFITLEEHFNRCNLHEIVSTELKEYLLNYFRYRPFNQEIVDLIKKLKSLNYHIYVLSDNNIECKNYYKNLDFFKNCFDGCIYSCDYGMTKKNIKLFEILLSNYSLNPLECYFIDNSISNIYTANGLNIKGFQYNENINDLISDMKKYGIINL